MRTFQFIKFVARSYANTVEFAGRVVKPAIELVMLPITIVVWAIVAGAILEYLLDEMVQQRAAQGLRRPQL